MENPMEDWGAEDNKRDPKTIGIVAYLTLIGWIVALIWNQPRTAHASFHIRQALGLMLIMAASNVVKFMPLGGMLAKGLVLGSVVLWAIAFLGALQGEQKPVPVLGDYFQQWFKHL